MTTRICLFITMLQWFAINAFAQPADTVKPLTYKNPLPVAFGDPYVCVQASCLCDESRSLDGRSEQPSPSNRLHAALS